MVCGTTTGHLPRIRRLLQAKPFICVLGWGVDLGGEGVLARRGQCEPLEVSV